MKLKYLLVMGFCFFGFTTLAQVVKSQISLIQSDNPVCSNTEMKIPAQVSGKFNDNNKFAIQVIDPSYNTEIASYDAVYKNGSFTFNIADEKLDAYNRVSYRVASTSPVTQSDVIYSRTFYSRGKITLVRSPAISDTINLGAGFGVGLTITTNNEVTITMSDSSTHSFSPGYLSPGIAFVASTSGDYYITKAVNSCNVEIPTSGKLTVQVNPISIIPIKINNQRLCEGSEVSLSFGSTGGLIPEAAVFKLRFLKTGFSEVNAQSSFEVLASRKGDILTAKIPDDVIPNSMPFQVAIVVDNPRLVSPYLSGLSIYEKPVASFRSQSDSVRIGEAFPIALTVSGPEPYTVELNDGKSYLLDNNLNLNLYPTKTETYSIKSLKTLCGVTTDLPKQTVVATVPAGIAINSAIGQKWEICENQNLRLPFVTNANLASSTKFTVEGITSKNTVYQFEAKLVNDSIEFFLPHSPAAFVDEGYFSITSFRVKTSNPSYTSEYRYGFTIRGIPRVSYKTSNSRTLTGPQAYTYDLLLSGGGPFSTVDFKGEKAYWDYSEIVQNIFVSASGNYGIKSVNNSCYAASDVSKLDLIVNPYTSQTPLIVVHPTTQKYLCGPDSVEVYFEAFGKFGDSNEFQITKSDNTDGPWLTVKKAGRYKLPVSVFGNNNSWLYINVKATNPKIEGSAPVPLILERKPVLLYPGDLGSTSAETPRVFNTDEIPRIYTQLDNYSPYTAEYSDGTNNYHFEQRSQYDAFYPSIPKLKAVPYTLKSLTNVCGTTDVNLTAYLYWKGYNLSTRYFADENRHYCVGEEIVLPFVVTNGTAPTGTVFSLQIGRVNEEYKTVASNTTGDTFKYVVPESMEGTYFMRIASSDGMLAGGYVIVVNKKPTATLAISSEYPNFSGEINYGESVAIDYKVTGGGPWKMVVNRIGEMSSSEDSITQSYKISKGMQFQIYSISNQCGYGTVSGGVSVRVKPQVTSLKSETVSVCSGSELKVRYSVEGDVLAGENIGFYLRNANGTRFELPSVTAKSGTIFLPISSGLRSGSYGLTCYVTGTEASLSQQINIDKAPDLTLSGNTTINPGEFTYIQIRPRGEGGQMLRVTLSDGTYETFQLRGYAPVYSVKVTPSSTTTYTIVSSESNCGTVQSSGSAIVTVNPPSARTVRVSALSKYGLFCESDTISVFYTKSGTFTAGNQFAVQVFDNDGKLAKALPTIGKESPLKVTIPTGFSVSDPYRLKVVATDANTGSSDYQQAIWFGTKATASFASNTVYQDESGKAQAVILLTGTGPWRYSYGSDLGNINRYADVAPDTLSINSSLPSVYFKLLSVSNSCGEGSVNEPSTIKIEIVLAVEEPNSGFDKMLIGPNPTTGVVTVRFETLGKRTYTLYNLSGSEISWQSSSAKQADFDLSGYPTGIYLLKVEQGKSYKMFKVIKD